MTFKYGVAGVPRIWKSIFGKLVDGFHRLRSNRAPGEYSGSGLLFRRGRIFSTSSTTLISEAAMRLRWRRVTKATTNPITPNTIV